MLSVHSLAIVASSLFLSVCVCEMKTPVRLFSAVLFLLLLLVATEMGPMVAEARTCESQSHRFKGICVRKSNCAAVCQTEGFHGGHCRGLRRRCFCTKHC